MPVQARNQQPGRTCRTAGSWGVSVRSEHRPGGEPGAADALKTWMCMECEKQSQHIKQLELQEKVTQKYPISSACGVARPAVSHLPGGANGAATTGPTQLKFTGRRERRRAA